MKLTKAIRESLVSRAIAALYDNRVVAARDAASEELETVLPSFGWLKWDDLPEAYRPFCSQTSTVYIYRTGTANLSFNLPSSWVYPQNRYTIGSYSNDYTNDSIVAWEAVIKEKATNTHALRQALNGINTSNQLAKLLPELTKYLPPGDANLLPVPQGELDRLNTILEGTKEKS